ncbi:hypothetical protein [Saccharopolyspora pogona]|uniref:hypothetical protein n=1 Tax=Saccharopolyspora pogona TaxID=333966 RepID=UPI0016897EF8|nr:hypothetical protein [Saccharopolyspora pogona]
MTAMLDRPAPAAGLPVLPDLDDLDIELFDLRPPVDEEVVTRILARAAGCWTPPIPKPNGEERIAVARHYVNRGQGTSAIARALHTNGTIARRLAETARLDQILDEIEDRL